MQLPVRLRGFGLKPKPLHLASKRSQCWRLERGGVRAMFESILKFLRDPANLAILGSIGAAIAAIACGAWAVFTYFDKNEKGPSAPNVTADHNSVAAGRDITAPVTIGLDREGGRPGASQSAGAAEEELNGWRPRSLATKTSRWRRCVLFWSSSAKPVSRTRIFPRGLMRKPTNS